MLRPKPPFQPDTWKSKCHVLALVQHVLESLLCIAVGKPGLESALLKRQELGLGGAVQGQGMQGRRKFYFNAGNL